MGVSLRAGLSAASPLPNPRDAGFPLLSLTQEDVRDVRNLRDVRDVRDMRDVRDVRDVGDVLIRLIAPEGL